MAQDGKYSRALWSSVDCCDENPHLSWRAIAMTVFATDSTQLNYRVAGVCVHEGHVLLHREEQDDFWVLPGGRPLLFEASPDTLVREMEEEIAARVEVLRLLCIVE